MSRSAAVTVQALGKLAKQALTDASQTASKQSRSMYTETGARYTPNQFAREAPLDRSSLAYSKNPYIESFMHRRDTLEREFVWDYRTTSEVSYFLGGIMVGFFAMGVMATREADLKNGYPVRDLLFARSNTGFQYPDERDWY